MAWHTEGCVKKKWKYQMENSKTLQYAWLFTFAVFTLRSTNMKYNNSCLIFPSLNKYRSYAYSYVTKLLLEWHQKYWMYPKIQWKYRRSMHHQFIMFNLKGYFTRCEYINIRIILRPFCILNATGTYCFTLFDTLAYMVMVMMTMTLTMRITHNKKKQTKMISSMKLDCSHW